MAKTENRSFHLRYFVTPELWPLEMMDSWWWRYSQPISMSGTTWKRNSFSRHWFKMVVETILPLWVYPVIFWAAELLTEHEHWKSSESWEIGEEEKMRNQIKTMYTKGKLQPRIIYNLWPTCNLSGTVFHINIHVKYNFFFVKFWDDLFDYWNCKKE